MFSHPASCTDDNWWTLNKCDSWNQENKIENFKWKNFQDSYDQIVRLLVPHRKIHLLVFRLSQNPSSDPFVNNFGMKIHEFVKSLRLKTKNGFSFFTTQRILCAKNFHWKIFSEHIWHAHEWKMHFLSFFFVKNKTCMASIVLHIWE